MSIAKAVAARFATIVGFISGALDIVLVFVPNARTYFENHGLVGWFLLLLSLIALPAACMTYSELDQRRSVAALRNTHAEELAAVQRVEERTIQARVLILLRELVGPFKTGRASNRELKTGPECNLPTKVVLA